MAFHLWSMLLTWQVAHAIGRRLMAKQSALHGFQIVRKESLFWTANKGGFVYSVRSDRDVMDQGGGTYVLVTDPDGAFAGLSVPSGHEAGTTVHTWIFALHVAMVWGLPFKIFVCVVGLVVTVLSVTGVHIWLRKRAAAHGKWRPARLRARA